MTNAHRNPDDSGDDTLIDNLPRGSGDGDLPDRLPEGSDDVEGTPTEDTGDETQRNQRRSTEEGVEDRPRDSGREDVESP